MTLVAMLALAAGRPVDQIRALIDAGAHIDPELADLLRKELESTVAADNLDALYKVLPGEINNIRKLVFDGRDHASGDI